MKRILLKVLGIQFCLLFIGVSASAQLLNPTNEQKAKYSGLFSGRPMIVERDRPEEWKNLVPGGQFMDRFLPMPSKGKLVKDTWGVSNVLPRYVDNGIEDETYSYWGGNSLMGKDGKYHMIVCRWLEDEAEGHRYYPFSDVVHAVSKDPMGPYKVKSTLFPGHNPNLIKLKDGRFMIKNSKSFYVESDGEGKSNVPEIKGLAKAWDEYPLIKIGRGRSLAEKGFMGFVEREDGSFLGLTRHGQIAASKTGYSPYSMLTEKRVYPLMEGRFEDPVIWRTNVQYHLIMNDWQGRIAYHMRSKDGLHWKLDDGVAYEPGIGITEDGIKNLWSKYEVIRISQDEYGRAIRVNFAAIDCTKKEDLGGDNHSSKVVYFPLTKGKLCTVVNDEKLSILTDEIKVKIQAEEDFNPLTDVNLSSLKFGISEEVNFGRGCPLIKSVKEGKDLILTFDGSNNKFTDEHFAGKLIGKMKNGDALFGYSRLPKVDYLEPILSAAPAKFSKIEDGTKIEVEVQNFGQVASEATPMKVIVGKEGNVEVILGEIPPLDPFEKTTVVMTRMSNRSNFKEGRSNTVRIQIDNTNGKSDIFTQDQILLAEKK